MQTFDKRTTPARPDLASTSLLGEVQAARFVDGDLRRVRGAVLDLRREPSHDSPLETQALHGEDVTVFDEHEGWAWLQLQRDGYVGYAAADALEPHGAAPSHRVVVPRTFVYARADIKSPVLLALPLGASLAAAEASGDFTRLATGGFVWTRHLDLATEHASDPVAVAETLLHAPYLWGGKTSLGIDCSGVVQVALAATGLAAPRDADMQERALGVLVPIPSELDGLARGDLMFWKGHVGLLRDPETLLHASGHHMRVVSEPLLEARARIGARSFGAITSIRRLALAR